MGLMSFNRMRLRKIEEMKPENITKEEAKLVEKDEVIINKEIEETKKEETATRGSKRKK